MKNLLVQLELLRHESKQLHYALCGESFYGKHLLMDRIFNDLSDFIDDIKENYYLCNNIDVPNEKDILTSVVYKLETNFGLDFLQMQLKEAIYTIEQIVIDNKTLTQGDFDLLGKISTDISKKLGLLNRVLKND